MHRAPQDHWQVAPMAAHQRFWRGEGPSLILIPAARHSLYNLNEYPRRFRDPQAMWESEMARARPLLDWPTDGIPTVRPNLGVIFIPAIAGQAFQLPKDAMPWPGPPLSKDAIRAVRQAVPEDTEVFRLAREFYRIHWESGEAARIAAYQPDTQGVFDVAHLLRGDDIFYDLADPAQADWLAELMDICFELSARTAQALKRELAEDPGSMVHGHGTEQGLYFPHAGLRVSEDTATLLSPAMIASTVLPAVTRCADRFGGVFAHFCGHHDTFLRQMVEMPGVKAIDLGNPELYDTRAVLESCAATGTVLYSRVAAEAGEDWKAYTLRLARLVRETGARVVLRPMLSPEARDDCRQMLELWHERTDR